MKAFVRPAILSCVILLLLTGVASAETLRVVVAGGVPFAISTSESLDGLSVDVWREVARRANLEYTLERVPSVESALNQVVSGEADVAVGPISITGERARRVAFTQPYYRAGLALASKPVSSLSALLWSLADVLWVLALFVLCLIVMGALMWWLERKKNPEFACVADGAWWALVTMSTVGYGKKVPESWKGKSLASFWIVVSLLFVSVVTASLTTALTSIKLRDMRIQNVADLKGERVGVVSGTNSVELARARGAHAIEARDLDEAVEALGSEVDSVLYDRPMLDYYQRQHPERELVLSPDFNQQGYGFAYRLDDRELGRALDVNLLLATDEGKLASVIGRWISPE